MNVIVFALETVPDVDAGKAIYDLNGLDDKGAAKAMLHLQQQKTGNTQLPQYLQKIVSLSVVIKDESSNTKITIESLSLESNNEKEIIGEFFDKVETLKSRLISWSGTSKELSLLHYRALKNRVVLPSFWLDGDYNHHDLQFLLSSYNFENTAPQNHIAKLLGLPGNEEVESSERWKHYLNGQTKIITNHCEISVLNSYLISLNYEFMRGEIDQASLQKEQQAMRDYLQNSGQNHLITYEKSWAN